MRAYTHCSCQGNHQRSASDKQCCNASVPRFKLLQLVGIYSSSNTRGQTELRKMLEIMRRDLQTTGQLQQHRDHQLSRHAASSTGQMSVNCWSTCRVCDCSSWRVLLKAVPQPSQPIPTTLEVRPAACKLNGPASKPGALHDTPAAASRQLHHVVSGGPLSRSTPSWCTRSSLPSRCKPHSRPCCSSHCTTICTHQEEHQQAERPGQIAVLG